PAGRPGADLHGSGPPPGPGTVLLVGEWRSGPGTGCGGEARHVVRFAGKPWVALSILLGVGIAIRLPCKRNSASRPLCTGLSVFIENPTRRAIRPRKKPSQPLGERLTQPERNPVSWRNRVSAPGFVRRS